MVLGVTLLVAPPAARGADPETGKPNPAMEKQEIRKLLTEGKPPMPACAKTLSKDQLENELSNFPKM